MKRLFDLVASLTGLVVLLPVLLVLAIAVRIDSDGPIIFRQLRVGLHGRLFSLLKFRSMRPELGGPEVTGLRDARVTRVGEWLRRYKLDELPQLWNVVRGDLSLVGPRPEVPKYVVHYPEEDRAIILSVRPGITDPLSLELFDEAAILGNADDYESTYINELLPYKLRRQREYVLSRTFWKDVGIILLTVLQVFGFSHLVKADSERFEQHASRKLISKTTSAASRNST